MYWKKSSAGTEGGLKNEIEIIANWLIDLYFKGLQFYGPFGPTCAPGLCYN